MPVTADDLTKFGQVCNNICFHLTAYLSAVAAGATSSGPPEVGQIYQLAKKLPDVDDKQWAGLHHKGIGAAGPSGSGAAPAGGVKAPGKRMKWTAETEQELIKLVDDEEYRTEMLGKEGTRGLQCNWAAVARHFGYSNGMAIKTKYGEMTGHPVEKKDKVKRDDDGEDGEKPAKKAKQAEPKAEPAAEPPSTAKKSKVAAAAAVPTSAAAEPTPGEESWSKKEGQELVKLVESQEHRKSVLDKKKLRWKKIGEHFHKKSKACKKQYTKLTGREAPEDDD